MRVSIIIPALRANHLLPAAVARLKQADGVDEIIIADGGTQPPPSGLGERVLVLRSKCGRGCQMAAGADAASGDWLLFLHADTRLGEGWMQAVQSHAGAAPGKAAAFRFALDDPSPAARRLEKIVAWRCQVLALPYGDQGLLISRTLYDDVGGFRSISLMEDVDIVRRLGRSRLALLDVPAVTSAARYHRDGYVRRMGRNLMCIALFYAGVSPERIVRLYA